MSDTDSLAELYARDPLELSDQDIEKIIERNRAARAAYQAGSKSAGNPKKLAVKKPQIELDLGDIDL